MSQAGIKGVNEGTTTVRFDARGTFTWGPKISGRLYPPGSSSYTLGVCQCTIGGVVITAGDYLSGTAVAPGQHCYTGWDSSTGDTDKKITLSATTWYYVTVQSGTGGTATGGGWGKGDVGVAVSAVASAHYAFTQWSDGSSTASRTITPSGDVTLAATFARNEWLVTLAAGANGSVSGGGWGSASNPVTIAAWSDAHYALVAWTITSGTGPAPTQAASATYAPNADVTLTATFAQSEWKVTTTTNDAALGGGYVKQDAGWVLERWFAPGSTVEVFGFIWDAKTANFISWTCTEDSAYNSTRQDHTAGGFAMPSKNLSFTATFYERKYRLTVAANDAAFGDAWADKDGTAYWDFYVWHTDTVTLWAIPKNTATVVGVFLGWYLNGGATPVSTSNSLVMAYQAYTLQAYVARFEEATEHAITTTVADAAAASAGCTLAVTTAANGDGKWYKGHTIEARATAEEGYQVAQWDMTIDGVAKTSILRSATPTAATLTAWGLPSTWVFGDALSFTLQGETAITATFDVVSYAVTYEVDDDSPVANSVAAWVGATESAANAKGTPYTTGAGVAHGDYVRLEATAGGTDSFRGWYRNDVLASTNAIITVQITSLSAFVAKFGNTVTVSAADANGTATVEGAASYAFTYGEEITILATPATGYFFSAWTESGSTLNGWGATYSFTPTGARTLVASFTATDQTIYLKLTNGVNSGFGELTLTVPEGFTATEMTEAAWETAVEAAYAPAIFNPYGSFGGDTSVGADSFWAISGKCSVTITCEVLEESARFTKWTVAYFKIYNEVITPPDPTQIFDYDTAVNAGTTQSAVIPITNHCKVTAIYYTPTPKRVTLNYATGGNATMGTLEGSPSDLNYTVGPPVQFDVWETEDFTAIAIAANGYKFDGWYSVAAATSGTLISADPQYTQTMETGVSVNTLYAKFSQDTDAVYEWEGSTANKMMTWRSKRYVSTRPANMTSARVYADGYPVNLAVYSASSPDAPVTDGNSASIQVGDQNARRLPMRRPDKYMEIAVQGSRDILEVAVASSMEGLIQ